VARQFKLRLGDGTMLVVDQDGLATWLIDDKAMAQPAGSRQWYPLKDVVAEVRIAVRAEEAARAKAAAPPKTEASPVAPPAAAAPPKTEARPVAPPATVAPPKPAPRRAPEAEPPPAVPLRGLAELEPGPPPGVTPLAEATMPRAAAPTEDVPVIRLKPLDDDDKVVLQQEQDLDELEEIVEEDAKGWPKAKAVLEAKAQPIVDTATAWVVREGWREIPGKVAAAAKETRSTASRAPRSWRRGAAVVGGLAVAVIAVLLTRSLWSPAPPPKVVYRPPPSVPTPVPEASLSPQVQAAVNELPHLSAQTVQRVMNTGVFEPSEMFRAAHAASRRGLDALTADEVLELVRLERAALAGLRSGDRARVRAYDRISAGRDLLAGEDARVLRLVARGARTLSPPRLERLQALLGKAVDAGLGPRPGASPAPATTVP
jgi:hypothetical protein